MAAAFQDQTIHALLQDKSDSSISVCGSCDEGATPTFSCRDCNEYLCNNCVTAHLTVSLTKDHSIKKLSGSPVASFLISKDNFCPIQSTSSNNKMTNSFSPTQSTSSNNKMTNSFSPTQSTSSNNKMTISNFCEIHFTEALQFHCLNCSTSICTDCASTAHLGHSYIYTSETVEYFQQLSADNYKLLADAKLGAQAVKDSLELNQKMIENVNARANMIRYNISTVIDRLHTAITEREAELIAKIENIRHVKGQVLYKQMESLQTTMAYFFNSINQLSEAIDSGTSTDLYNTKIQTLNEFENLSKNVKVSLSPEEDDIINFHLHDTGLLRYISSFGEITCVQPPPPPIGEGFRAIQKRMSSLSLELKSPHDELAHNGGSNHLFPNGSSFFGSNNNNILSLDSSDRQDSSYLCLPPYNWNYNTDSQSGMNCNRVSLPPVRNVQQYSNTGGAILIIGKEGNGDGDLCRPWGVCCDWKGNIIVADRSNNRIQIFSRGGYFLHKFGSYGSEPGQFDRPAGVATNPTNNNIVVADKDNHRIQIFTHDGQFISTFGDKGSKTGQFNYPWDVDCNTNGHIVVSDTRNHRIQLFTATGSFLNKYGFENSNHMWKHFDSPRGVCFSTNSKIIVTDFNNHRLVVIESNCEHARFLGSLGPGVKQFDRPQGVVVDQEGHIVVADSRNNRIQVFDHNGTFLWKFGSEGKKVGQFDRPSGICLTPDGNIAVVDFGNNRVQLF